MMNNRSNTKTIKLSIIILMTIFFVARNTLADNDGFYAYYTKVQHSATDYLSDFADIIVVLGDVTSGTVSA